jgi:hypothetical protein
MAACVLRFERAGFTRAPLLQVSYRDDDSTDHDESTTDDR